MLNLRPMFERIGRLFTRELRRNIELQIDINGERYSPIKKSTAMARQRARGLGQGLAIRLVTGAKKMRVRKTKRGLMSNLSVPITRLLFTKNFMNNAFQYKSDNEFVEIFVSRKMYHSEEATGSRSLLTYAEIVAYNQKNSPEVNPNITKPPLVFPTNRREVEQMDSWMGMQRIMKQEIYNIRQQIVGEGIRIKEDILL